MTMGFIASFFKTLMIVRSNEVCFCNETSMSTMAIANKTTTMTSVEIIAGCNPKLPNKKIQRGMPI